MNEHDKKIMFSSKSEEWETPDTLFENMDKRFKFTLDPASTKENAKCVKYYTKEDNGLLESWYDETVFVNPPYGRGVDKWVAKAYLESELDDKDKVMLIAARTDTQYFNDYCTKAAEIYFIKGRLKFGNVFYDNPTSAAFPSVIIVFNSERNGNRDVYWTNRDFTEFW